MRYRNNATVCRCFRKVAKSNYWLRHSCPYVRMEIVSSCLMFFFVKFYCGKGGGGVNEMFGKTSKFG